MVYPLPAVLVSCGSEPGEFNIITIAWTGTICTVPPMCYISVRQNRHSFGILHRYMDFVINLTTKNMIFETDWCGIKSGKDYNKFETLKLTPIKSDHVKAPMILESPVNIECKVKETKQLGSHDMFIADVMAIHVDENLIDKQTGAVKLEKAELICYAQHIYYEVGAIIGKYGFSANIKK